MKSIGFIVAALLLGSSASCSSPTPIPDCWKASQLPVDRPLSGHVIIIGSGKSPISMNPVQCEGEGAHVRLPQGVDLQSLVKSHAVRSFMGARFYEADVVMQADKGTSDRKPSFSVTKVNSIKEIGRPIWFDKASYEAGLDNGEDDGGEIPIE